MRALLVDAVPLPHRALLTLALLLFAAAARAGAPAQQQSITANCGRETVFFHVAALTAKDGSQTGIEVGPLMVRDRAGSLPFLHMKRAEEAGAVVLTWGDSTAAGERIAITIPWENEAEGRLVTDEDRMRCERGGQEEEIPFDDPPVVIKLFAPEYPVQAKQAKIEGVVYVRMTIAETGRVIEARVHRSESIAVLDAAAVEAAKLSIFRPATRGGVAIKSRVVLPFRFKL
jgi:protein TonB